MTFTCFKESYCTVHGCRCSEGKHGTLFSVKTNVQSVRDSAALRIPLSGSLSTQIQLAKGTLSLIPHGILSLSDPSHVLKCRYNPLLKRELHRITDSTKIIALCWRHTVLNVYLQFTAGNIKKLSALCLTFTLKPIMLSGQKSVLILSVRTVHKCSCTTVNIYRYYWQGNACTLDY